ncbi:MAG: hypothetical protein U5L96_14125 [Owenweeksia sp.]|nr:hypothetical protein [Owenweeksia sp.]
MVHPAIVPGLPVVFGVKQAAGWRAAKYPVVNIINTLRKCSLPAPKILTSEPVGTSDRAYFRPLARYCPLIFLAGTSPGPVFPFGLQGRGPRCHHRRYSRAASTAASAELVLAGTFHIAVARHPHRIKMGPSSLLYRQRNLPGSGSKSRCAFRAEEIAQGEKGRINTTAVFFILLVGFGLKNFYGFRSFLYQLLPTADRPPKNT